MIELQGKPHYGFATGSFQYNYTVTTNNHANIQSVVPVPAGSLVEAEQLLQNLTGRRVIAFDVQVSALSSVGQVRYGVYMNAVNLFLNPGGLQYGYGVNGMPLNGNLAVNQGMTIQGAIGVIIGFDNYPVNAVYPLSFIYNFGIDYE